MQPQSDHHRNRARENLRAFYKLSRPTASSSLTQSADPRTASLPERPRRHPSKAKNPLDIDGSHFEAKRYLKKILVEQEASGLLAKDNELVSQVRQIDGEMKTMIYENYSKFISAAETIRKMKQDADFIDAEMSKLSRRVNEISSKTSKVNANFAQRREHIHRLSSEHRLLANLQLLFDLPDQLSRFISSGRFVDAARAWSRMQPLLLHYRQLGAFASVEKDGKQLMASVESTIWDRWNLAETGISEGAECASLLVLLRPDRASKLSCDYLEIQSAKNRTQRQKFLEEAYEYPVVCGAAETLASIGLGVAAGPSAAEPDPTMLPTTAAFPAIPDSKLHISATTCRVSHFNDCYLPVWSSLVIGFASQFVSPAGSGLLEKVSSLSPDSEASAAQRANRSKQKVAAQQGRTMSLLEATTEGTVVGLLSPLAEETAVSSGMPALSTADDATGVAAGLANLKITTSKQGQPVVGWQAMSQQELDAAQQVFSEHLHEWAAEYEFIIDSLIQLPDDATAASIGPFLDQLDQLVGSIYKYPILVRIGGLRDCVFRVVERWQRQLIEGILNGIIRDMSERLEYYFDPNIDVAGSGAGLASAPRRSSASRHQRNSSIKSNGSQASFSTQSHQRSGSVLSNTPQQQANNLATSPMVGVNASPQSPLTVQTQSPLTIQTQQQQVQNARGLAHARAVSSAFEALSNPPLSAGTASLSPSLPPFVPSSTQQRLSRASTINQSANRSSIHSTLPGGSTRAGALRRARHQRTLSSALADMADSQDDFSRLSDGGSFSQQPARRSLSFHRGVSRRYRPWLIGSVNRSAPLHVFLADTESWLIQQILERLNPLLERVVQHYLDIEGSQLLDEDEGSADEDSDQKQKGSPRKTQQLSLQSASRMRQSFIQTLDGCLDAWMSSGIPDAFLYSALASPVHGTRTQVDQTMAKSPMAQLGVALVGDPVLSLLLARFAVDFELTLSQSIYQLCEHGISITPGADASALSSADDISSASNTMGAAGRGDFAANDPVSDRLQSITASVTRADSIASHSSRRGTALRAAATSASGSMLTMRHSSHAAKWHSVAEKLVCNFVMTVGQDISADYLRLHPYGNISEDVGSDDGMRRMQVQSVSEVWLSICHWMKRVEEDTNALFYDPVFSETLKALNSRQMGGSTAADADSKPGSFGQTPSGTSLHSSNQQQQQQQQQMAAYNQPSSVHAHILSNIDRLFAERVDIFPKNIDPLKSGKILFYLAMQIIKAALEAVRLQPTIIRTKAEFQQIIVDAAFVRSWMLRYTGIAPNFNKLSSTEPCLSKSTSQVFAETTRQSSKNLLPSGTCTPAINERDAQAIHNLLDDWIITARAYALHQTMPKSQLVDKIVYNAWMSVIYHNNSL
ncbi:hypothetical protein BX667DRAFT_497814 [Coemansia mojavensis]|nr:hypothetical protein BX667DRAFT_497814 [Coemansia mojavensis]